MANPKKKRLATDGWGQLNATITGCEKCPRLISHCQQVATEKRKSFRHEGYWGRPVPNLVSPVPVVLATREEAVLSRGVAPAGPLASERRRLLIVGLAPAAHGANRTGRMFTGDRSGDWLYRALWKGGLATQAESTHREDGLQLVDCAITAVCHCAPPANKPSPEEIQNCRPYLLRTIEICEPKVIVALGRIAWDAILKLAKTHPGTFCSPDGMERRESLGQSILPPTAQCTFGHATEIQVGQITLLGSYHPSQQNTFTGRLTEAMLDSVIARAVSLMS